MVMTPGYNEVYAPGAFDHWQGETVPIRGPDREIVGEATIVRVDHREDGQVWIIVESELDMNHHQVAGIAGLMRGRNDMSFSIREPDPFRPRRDDAVARWLKKIRDEYQPSPFDSRESGAYWAIDGLLDEYRARADYGLTLGADLSELPDGY